MDTSVHLCLTSGVNLDKIVFLSHKNSSRAQFALGSF